MGLRWSLPNVCDIKMVDFHMGVRLFRGNWSGVIFAWSQFLR